jgi:4-azaleucine resistance transporter AzlC
MKKLEPPAKPSSAPDSPATILTRDGVWRGFRDTLAIAVLVAPYGLAVGLAASDRGLEPWLAALMSALVFAGASQFASIELWREPLPVVLILVTVAVVNARHLLYGAVLYPWLRSLPAHKRYPIMGMMTDTSWAHTTAAIQNNERDAGVLVGSGLGLWLVWWTTTWVGATFGASIGNPKTYGLDVVMLGFFAATLVTMWRGRGDLAPWFAAAAASAAGVYLLPTGWNILAGAIVGGIVGVLVDDR